MTKRLHNHLHGYAGDGGPLGAAEARTYRETVAPTAVEIARRVGPDDAVLLHDPQPAGLVGPLGETGATVVWRCHIGIDEPNDLTRDAWDFLRPHVERADAFVFSRKEYVWDGLDPAKVAVIPPSIDAFSPKNQDLDDSAVRAITAVAGLVDDAPHGGPVFTREDGSQGWVERAATFVDGGDPPPASARLPAAPHAP